MKLTEFKKLIREEIQKELAEARIPDNIKSFATRKSSLPLVMKVAKWAEKAG